MVDAERAKKRLRDNIDIFKDDNEGNGKEPTLKQQVFREVVKSISDEKKAQRDYEKLIGNLQELGLNDMAKQVMEVRDDEQDHERIFVEMRRELKNNDRV